MFSTRHVVTGLVATALVAGMGSTNAVAETGGSGSGSGTGSSAVGGSAGGGRWVTLITGDRVAVDGRGRVTAVERGEGRARIPVRTWTERGRTYVVPVDAERLIARGTVDRRLFDVTALSRVESRRAYRDGLKVIVAYEGAAEVSARKGVRADAEVRRTLSSLNADAVTVAERDAGALWSALTRTVKGEVSARTAPGVARVWLDAVRTVNLETSVGAIGAPKAWEAGYDGTGVKIAVLDTGVDANHADLRGKVEKAGNFSDSPDAVDRHGHGTHVAATAAGTGAHSNGKFKGVAPGATVLSAKVLDDGGSGSDSGILAGMDWAVAQGADVINMSLGGQDSPGQDPLELRIDQLTKEKGVLFAVAAGNSGPQPGTVDSPGSADAALTVGAVDDSGAMAGFSSVGPRVGDGAVKPDVTGPGVDITAAAARDSLLARQNGESPQGYLTISGTSMATPHAAGAAALLKQRNPDWSGTRLKSVLTASAKDGGHSAFHQGTGRIAVDRALAQTVVSDESSVSFGRQNWPHTDDRPVTKNVTYRNLGDQPVTLDLTIRGLDPQGRPAPAGFFTLGADRVTVPRGGTATVPVTADTRIGGDNEGAYTAAVVATGGGQTVRTAAAVDREVESYDLTLNYKGPDGKPSNQFVSYLGQLSGVADAGAFDREGRPTVKFRLPKGEYVLNAMREAETPAGFSIDRLVHPKLALTRDTTVEVDARLAKQVRMSAPDAGVPMTDARATYEVSKGRRMVGSTEFVGVFDNYRIAQLGPARPTGVTLHESFNAQWGSGAGSQYNAAAGGVVDRLSNGHSSTFRRADFARVSALTGSTVKGKKAVSAVVSALDGMSSDSDHPYKLPGSRTHYVATAGKVNAWALNVMRLGADGSYEAGYDSPVRHFRPGTTRQVTMVGTGVHSPLTHEFSGVKRAGDDLWAEVPLFSDGPGNAGWSAHTSAKTALYRGTTRIGEIEDALEGSDGFPGLAPEEAEYTLTTSVRRSPAVDRTSTRIDGSWTFRSARTPEEESTRIPLSMVRFGASTGLDGSVPAGRASTFPVTVQGPAAGSGLASLAVSVSYDAGATWHDVPVRDGRVTVRNPAEGKSVALRGEVTDTRGGKGSVTVYDAYFGR